MLKRIALSAWRGVKAFFSRLPILLLDLAGLAALGLISYGTWLIYVPAGFIIAGALLLVAVILLSPRRALASSDVGE